MLVFISDLHFTDGTAGEHNVKTGAFDGVLQDLAVHAKKARAEEVKIIFLGDIFDLIRTEKWFDFDEDERPWGSNESKIELNAESILNDIISKNQSTFDIFKSERLGEKYGFDAELERIYIPGNHDRLCNRYESLRAIVRKNLGIKNKKPDELFDYCYLDPKYNVLARHGNEFDDYNYEGGKDYESFEAHTRVPLGDPITTELVAKLPWAIKKRLLEENIPGVNVDRIYMNLQEIENVRPLEATIIWLFHQVQIYRNIDEKLKKIVSEVINEVIKEFENLKFVRNWYEVHDKFSPLDSADKVQLVLWMLKRLRFDFIDEALSLIDRIKKLSIGKDNHVEAAIREKPFPNVPQFHVVYGHTHEPKQVPLQIINNTKHIYLNTGTWRARHRCCQNGYGFITWKDLTYVIIYNKDESPLKYPSFETWSGNLKDVD